ncbi:MAG: porin family protein [Devosia sp.]|jgi:outer membrane immunogenic protein|nr:porin family protein [Devosia sp.]
MIRVVLGGLLAATAMVSVATAADLIVEQDVAEAAIAAAHDWSGGYVGAHIGYGWGTAEAVDTDAGGGFFDEDTGETFSVDASGFLAGLQAGANWQMDSIVLGVEGQVGFLSASGENFLEPEPDNFGTLDFGWYADLTGRLGFAADSALFYLKGGVAAARVETTFGDLVDGSLDPDTDSTGSFAGTRFGWTVGAGIEMALDDNWSVKAEYQYYDLGTEELVDIQGDTADVSFTAQTVKVGLNYGF